MQPSRLRQFHMHAETPHILSVNGRAQVWDKRAQSQVLQVAPFLPRRARSATATAQEMAAEMERVQVLPAITPI